MQHDLNQFESEMKQRYNGAKLITGMNLALTIQTATAQLFG
jgi:mannose/fructose-specific phosphotransferase system component IIA